MSDSSLNIEQSLMGARWRVADDDLSQVERVARAHDLPEIVARLLVARDIPLEEIEHFLNPTLKNDFPDPFSLIGMEGLANDLAQVIEKKCKIAIFGDFDVDGATSSALLYRFLKHCGVDAQLYIPQRLSEGYGPNEEALKTLRDEGAEVLLILDCGTTSFDTLAYGKDLGLKIAVLDHHEAEERLPDLWHMVNPKRKDDESGLDVLAAVGVVFMTCVAVNAKLRERGFYKEAGTDEAPLKDWLDLVALGTVCDMVPLTGVNRLLVRQGFMLMNHLNNPGIAALAQVAKINAPFSPYHAGFIFGPRINAGSRVHKSDLGAKLLCSDDREEAQNIAWTLNDCNDKRKAIQMDMEREAIDKVEAQGLDQNPVIIVGDEGWHSGLSGLVAGRLKDKYKKPACVVTYAKNPAGVLEGRGSGRSVSGIHIAQAFIDARNMGLLEKGGGHAMAAGFTVCPERLGEFTAFLYQHIEKQAAESGSLIETQIDGLVSVQGLKPEFLKIMEAYVGPFGQAHPEPLFVLNNVRIHNADIVGEAHIRCMVSDWEGGPWIKAMAFRSVETPLGDALLKAGTRPFHLAGHLKVDDWSGVERVEMHIRDGALVH